MPITDKNLPLDKIPIKVFGFKPYDIAVAKELTTDLYPDPKDESIILTIAPIFAGMQREFSTQPELDPTAEPQDYIKTEKTVKLPASSLSRQGWEFDITRWSRADYNLLKWTDEGNRIIQSPHPLPFEILYQFDMWTKYRSTMNQFVHRIATKFWRKEVWIPVNIGEPWGVKRVALKLAFGGPQELSNMELDEMDDRTFRMVMTFNLDAWLFTDATSIPTIRKVNLGDGNLVVAKVPPV